MLFSDLVSTGGSFVRLCITFFFVLVLGFTTKAEIPLGNELEKHLKQLLFKLEEDYEKSLKKYNFNFFPFYERSYFTEINSEYNFSVKTFLENYKALSRSENQSSRYLYRELLRSNNINYRLYFTHRLVDFCRNKTPTCIPSKLLTFFSGADILKDYIARISLLDKINFTFRDLLLIHNYTKEGETETWAKNKIDRLKNRQFISYRKLNEANPGSDKLTFNLRKDTIEALKKLPFYEGVLYSGQKTTKNLEDLLKVGEEVCIDTFLSSSKDKKVAGLFASRAKSPYLYKIISKTARDMKSVSELTFEEEVVYMPFKRFRIAQNSYTTVEEINFTGELEAFKVIILEEVADSNEACRLFNEGLTVRPY
jgi:hypothetical protein